MASNERLRSVSFVIGDVKHTVKSESLLRCPNESPLAGFVKHLRKGGRSNEKVFSTANRDGHSFAYILHYIATGDLVYPLHEGFHRVDALLKELAFFGLVEDVIRNATQDGSAKGKRRQYLFVSNLHKNATDKRNESEQKLSVNNGPVSNKVVLSKSLSYQSVRCGDDGGLTGCFSVSVGDLVNENEVNGVGGVCDSDLNRVRREAQGRRFLALVKRYLSLKSVSKVEDNINPTNHSVKRSKTFGPTQWNLKTNSGGGGGVFRPTSAHGATLVLVSSIDCVTIFGQRGILESIFPDYRTTPLRTTSSAFIDAQLIYQLEEEHLDLEYSPTVKKRSQSDLLWHIYSHRIQKRGFLITVQSQWRDDSTFEDNYQWLLHKKTNAKNSMGRRSSLSLITAQTGTQLGRKTSVLQRWFQRTPLTVQLNDSSTTDKL